MDWFEAINGLYQAKEDVGDLISEDYPETNQRYEKEVEAIEFAILEIEKIYTGVKS